MLSYKRVAMAMVSLHSSRTLPKMITTKRNVFLGSITRVESSQRPKYILLLNTDKEKYVMNKWTACGRGFIEI